MKPNHVKDTNGAELPVRWQDTIKALVMASILLEDYPDDMKPIFTLVNPNTGIEAKCNQLCYNLCNWLTGPHPLTHRGERFTMAQWHQIRNVVNVCWPDVYYSIID